MSYDSKVFNSEKMAFADSLVKHGNDFKNTVYSIWMDAEFFLKKLKNDGKKFTQQITRDTMESILFLYKGN